MQKLRRWCPDAIGNLNDKVLLQRIIIGSTYTHSEKLRIAFHIQDSRAFGWSLQKDKYPDLYKICQTGTESTYYMMNPQEEYFEIYDLFVEYKQLLKNFRLSRKQKFSTAITESLIPQYGVIQDVGHGCHKISYKKGRTMLTFSEAN